MSLTIIDIFSQNGNYQNTDFYGFTITLGNAYGRSSAEIQLEINSRFQRVIEEQMIRGNSFYFINLLEIFFDISFELLEYAVKREVKNLKLNKNDFELETLNQGLEKSRFIVKHKDGKQFNFKLFGSLLDDHDWQDFLLYLKDFSQE